MSTMFSGDTGYRGVVKLNDVILLATSGNFSQSHQAIRSSGVWGAGYQNAAEVVAYANDFVRLEGSLGCEVTAGAVFNAIKLFAFENRGNPNGTKITILPNGEHGFNGVGWCTQLSFNSSQNAILTSDMSFSSYLDGKNNTITTGDNSNSELGASGGKLPFEYNGLFPYWMNTIVDKDGNSVNDIISWSASYSSSIEMLKCCGTKEGSYTSENGAPLAPDYIGLGQMSATFNCEVFKLQGDFAPESFHNSKGFTITVGSPVGESHKIVLPWVVCDSNSSQITNGSGWIQASFQYTAIGDGKIPPMGLDPDTNTGGDVPSEG